MSYRSPVYDVIAVPIEKVKPNTYNPNKVAPPEMRLLYESIKEDGYTMPVVCYYVKAQDIYLIIDGFHRYQVMLNHPDIYELSLIHIFSIIFILKNCCPYYYFSPLGIGSDEVSGRILHSHSNLQNSY